MKTYRVTAWHYPAHSASIDIQADSAEEALKAGRDYDWTNEPFEDCGAWDMYPALIRAENSEDDSDQAEHGANDAPEAHAHQLLARLREFVEDVKLAHGTGQGDMIDGNGLDWPDLAITYGKAVALLNMIESENR